MVQYCLVLSQCAPSAIDALLVIHSDHFVFQMPPRRRKATKTPPAKKSARSRSRVAEQASSPDPPAADGSSALLSPPPAAAGLDLTAFLDVVVDRVTERLTGLAPPPTAPAASLTPVPALTPHAPPPELHVPPHVSSLPPPTPTLPPAAPSIVNQALSQLLGECPNAGTPHPGPSMPLRLSAPLGSHVNVALRSKIWCGEFIELSQLLPPTNASTPSTRTYAHSGKPKASEHSATAMPFTDFITAFHIFIAVRIERHPQDAAGLLKHLEAVRDMQKSFGPQAWYQYDRSFRSAMQFDPAMRWGQLDTELYMQAVAHGMYANQRRSSMPRATDDPRLKTNSCWRFQRNGRCTHRDCPFRSTHKCSTCGDPEHGSFQCTKSAKPESAAKTSAKQKPFRDGGSGGRSSGSSTKSDTA